MILKLALMVLMVAFPQPPKEKREAKDKPEEVVTNRLRELDTLLRNHAKELARQKTTADFQDKAQEMIAPFEEWVRSIEGDEWIVDTRVLDVVKKNGEYFLKCDIPRQLSLFEERQLKPVIGMPHILPVSEDVKPTLLPGDTIQISGKVRTETIDGHLYNSLSEHHRRVIKLPDLFCKIAFCATDPLGQKQNVWGHVEAGRSTQVLLVFLDDLRFVEIDSKAKK